ncbi:flippase [Mycolicibacterium gilvum]|nr:flippase [Mycolicibacterium gilvum]
MVASLLTVTATTRYLGPSLYGDVTTAVMFVGLWMSLAELGIGAVLVRRVTSGRGDLERLVRINAGLSVSYCIPLYAVAAASGTLIYWGDRQVVAMILIVAASLTLTTLSTCFIPVFLATVRFRAVALSDLLGRSISFALTVILVKYEAGVLWFAVVQLVPPAVVLVIQGGAAKSIVNCTPIFSIRESWDLLRESLPQTVILIIGVLYYRIDGVILSLLSSPDEVGVYGLAFTLTTTVGVLAQFFLSSTLSTMTGLYARDRQAFTNFISKSLQIMICIGAPVAIVGWMLAGELIELVGSAAFVHRGAPTLAILSLSIAITFVTGVLGQALFAAHDQRFLMNLNLVALVINIILNIILVPQHGAQGAAVSLVATNCIGLLVATWRLRRRVSIQVPWLFLLRLTVPLSLCIGAMLALRELPVAAVSVAAATVYLVVNVIVGPVSLRMIRSVVART